MSELKKWVAEYVENSCPADDPDAIALKRLLTSAGENGALRLLMVAAEDALQMEDGPHNSYWAGMKEGKKGLVRVLKTWCRGEEV